MSGSDKVKVGVLISGRGSNMASLIAAAADPAYPATIALVVSNRPDAAGLARAAAAGVPAEVVDHKAFPDRERFERALDDRLRASAIELVALAGFMRVLTSWFVRRWEGRLVNVHPSLLPAFRGVDTHARALAAGVAEHGCSVHLVTPELDAGPVIAQETVPVLPGDTAETLAARVLEREHALYPRALARYARGLRGLPPEPDDDRNGF